MIVHGAIRRVVKRLDWEDLRWRIRHMTYKQRIYKVLREELGRLGYWRNVKRGNPQKGYAVMKERKQAP